jgi:hypothetical protein
VATLTYAAKSPRRSVSAVGESSQMKLLIVLLAIQTIAGFALAFRSISFNMWESNEGIHSRDDRMSLVTGIVFLASAGLGWYGYLHNVVWCWGFSGLRLLKTCVDAIGLVLLYFIFFRAKSIASTETSEVGE